MDIHAKLHECPFTLALAYLNSKEKRNYNVGLVVSVRL